MTYAPQREFRYPESLIDKLLTARELSELRKTVQKRHNFSHLAAYEGELVSSYLGGQKESDAKIRAQRMQNLPLQLSPNRVDNETFVAYLDNWMQDAYPGKPVILETGIYTREMARRELIPQLVKPAVLYALTMDGRPGPANSAYHYTAVECVGDLEQALGMDAASEVSDPEIAMRYANLYFRQRYHRIPDNLVIQKPGVQLVQPARQQPKLTDWKKAAAGD